MATERDILGLVATIQGAFEASNKAGRARGERTPEQYKADAAKAEEADKVGRDAMVTLASIVLCDLHRIADAQEILARATADNSLFAGK